MYAAKHGKRGAQLYDTSLDSGSAQTLSLLSELRHAVEHGELRLFMQPKVRVDNGMLCGAEALVRWQHPQRGLVPPVQFIPFAEQTGYVRQLTLWVFEEAARQQAALLALGLQRVSINLSTRDLMDVELPDKLEAILLRQQARAEGFCLEITEGAIMDDAARAKATLERLSQRGYKLSIDDFGTGYSSLAYLQQLPVQELKIDMSFVKGMEKNPGDETIVRSTIELAHNLGPRRAPNTCTDSAQRRCARGVRHGGKPARAKPLDTICCRLGASSSNHLLFRGQTCRKAATQNLRPTARQCHGSGVASAVGCHPTCATHHLVCRAPR